MRNNILVLFSIACAISATAFHPRNASAWGGEGHKVVALIALHYLTPATKAQVEALLAGDTSHLTGTDIADEATWADAFRDSDRRSNKANYEHTHRWHFIDLQIVDPSAETACFGYPDLEGQQASNEPAKDCAPDKIKEFIAELTSPTTSPAEKRLALQFLLHLVGDIHQPLHAADNNDAGGNARRVAGPSVSAKNLHAFWDTAVVHKLGAHPSDLAAKLVSLITPAQTKEWSTLDPFSWAADSFQVAAVQVYGALPQPDDRGVYHLPLRYVTNATDVAATQLSKAGIRLAAVLNNALKR